jgi:hypothetical protein
MPYPEDGETNDVDGLKQLVESSEAIFGKEK